MSKGEIAWVVLYYSTVVSEVAPPTSSPSSGASLWQGTEPHKLWHWCWRWCRCWLLVQLWRAESVSLEATVAIILPSHPPHHPTTRYHLRDVECRCRRHCDDADAETSQSVTQTPAVKRWKSEMQHVDRPASCCYVIACKFYVAERSRGRRLVAQLPPEPERCHFPFPPHHDWILPIGSITQLQRLPCIAPTARVNWRIQRSSSPFS